MELDYAADLHINPDELDVELLCQPDLSRKYAHNLTQKKKLVAKLEEQIKVMKAELTRRVMIKPMKTVKKDNPTGPLIEAYYRTRPEYRELKAQWIEAVSDAEYAELAYKAVTFDRKQALADLVQLHHDQYFAGPSDPRDLSKEWKARNSRERSNEAVSKAMKTKTRKEITNEA